MSYWQVVLDPNKETTVCEYEYQNSPNGLRIRFVGAWCPGLNHPTWGPEGDPNTQFNGGNKWCVMVRIYKNGSSIIHFPYIPEASADEYTQILYSFPAAPHDIITITACMNDDYLGDNFYPNKEASMMGFAKSI